MPSKIGHPCFEPPTNEEIQIWRYMDFTKYVSFLEDKSLFFNRADKFEDPYEGAMSHANHAMRPEVYGDEIPPHVFAQLAKYNEWTRQWTYINCWHMNECESAAMWKLYAKTEEAVAIQTTYRKLHLNLPETCYVGTVKYIDYDKDWLPENNTLWLYVHKRKSFEHEREIRAVVQETPTGKDGIDIGMTNSEYGKKIEVDPALLIEKVFVSPTAPKWFYNIVKNITAKLGYSIPVHQSNLSKTPVF